MARKRIRSHNLVRVRLLIREVSEAKGFSQTKLSRQAELQYTTVHGLWTNPYRDASIFTLVKIASALHCEVSELYEIEQD